MLLVFFTLCFKLVLYILLGLQDLQDLLRNEKMLFKKENWDSEFNRENPDEFKYPGPTRSRYPKDY